MIRYDLATNTSHIALGVSVLQVKNQDGHRGTALALVNVSTFDGFPLMRKTHLISYNIFTNHYERPDDPIVKDHWDLISRLIRNEIAFVYECDCGYETIRDDPQSLKPVCGKCGLEMHRLTLIPMDDSERYRNKIKLDNNGLSVSIGSLHVHQEGHYKGFATGQVCVNGINTYKDFIYHTGMEYDINPHIFYKVAAHFKVKPVLLAHPKGFLGLLLEDRLKFPDSKVRWCTFHLKSDITDKWIRANRHVLGERCLFVSGERRDESPRRQKLPETDYHRTHLKTARVANFTCHWHRPCLEYEKEVMFAQGKKLKLPPHPCYEYVDRCSCMFCVLMKDRHAIENMKRHPEKAIPWIQAEIKINHTWKHRRSLQQLWATACTEIEDELLTATGESA